MPHAERAGEPQDPLRLPIHLIDLHQRVQGLSRSTALHDDRREPGIQRAGLQQRVDDPRPTPAGASVPEPHGSEPAGPQPGPADDDRSEPSATRDPHRQQRAGRLEGLAQPDLERGSRRGAPEAVLCDANSPAQVSAIAAEYARLAREGAEDPGPILFTPRMRIAPGPSWRPCPRPRTTSRRGCWPDSRSRPSPPEDS